VVEGSDCDDTDPNVLGERGWYPDADGDGYVDPTTQILACEQPDGYLPCFDETCADCDDTDPNVSAGSVWYPDADADGFVNPSTPLLACEQPDGYLPCFDVTCGDCDDTDPYVHEGCGAPEGYGGSVTGPPGDEMTAIYNLNSVNDYDLDMDGILDSLETSLMETFAPVMWLYSTDPYKPASVEWLFQRDDAVLVMDDTCLFPGIQGPGMKNLLQPIGDGTNLFGWENVNCNESSGPGGGFADHIYIDMVETSGDNSIYLGDMYSAPYYVTVSRDPTNYHFAINYWFFYVYNGCGYDDNGVEYCIYSTHEGDWEHITVYVQATKWSGGRYNFTPTYVSFYYHGKNEGRRWDQVYTCDDPNRVCAFSALHTHATYYKWGKHDSQITGAINRRDYTNNGFIWDPLKREIVDWYNDPDNPRPMDLPQGGILNVGQRPLIYSRSYFDPSMGVPMPGMEWILYQGRWGVDGDVPPGPGTPDFQWYENQPGNPPVVWKVPDQQAKAGVNTTFDLGKVFFFGDPPITIKVDWGDGNFSTITSNSSGVNELIDHTYTTSGTYLVEVTAVITTLWGGNVFKVTVEP
jgi:hypothetical protein